MTSSWKLSPSDLTFLWDECPRCFYLKVVLGFNRPAAPFPKIFNRIDKLMKDFFTGKSTSELSPELPPGAVRFAERWVQSQPISLPNHTHSCYLRGKFDSLLEFSDRTFGVVDFKTSEARPEHINFYSRQLHAYAYALEHSSTGSLSVAPISRLGLFCVEPIGMERLASGQVAYLGNVSWLEVPKSEASFIEFLNRVLSVLEQDTPPEKGTDCAYCDYRAAACRDNL
jgi:hypothetical protein